MIVNNYLDFEAQHMCEVCNEIVTNPLCPECLTTEIRAWVTLYPDLSRVLVPRLLRYLKKVDDESPLKGVKCIKCKKSRTFVCPYCFTNYVQKELARLETNRIVLREFLDFFNFDQDNPDYYRESTTKLI